MNASTSYGSQLVEEPVLGNNGSNAASAFDPQSVVNVGLPVSSSDNIILENLDSERSRQNHSDVTRRLDSDTRALLLLSDFFVSFRTFGSRFETSGTWILPDVLSGGVSDISSREARRNTGATSSRHRYKRESDFPSLFLTTSLDDFGSRDCWLFDNSGDRHHHQGRAHGYSTSHGGMKNECS